MASFGSKKEITKRDMNFFAEFTAAAARLTRLLTYGVIALVVVIAIIIAIVVYCVIRNAMISKSITDMQTLLSSEEYTSLDAEAANLAEALNEKNNYYYSLSQMRKQIDTKPAAKVQLTDVLAKSIPSDSYVESYTINGIAFKYTGYAFSYYSVVDMVNILNQSEVFSAPVQLEISRVDPSAVGTLEDFIKNPINNYYQFSVTGTLVSDVYVTYGRYTQLADGSVASLGAVQTNPYKAGTTYKITDIAAYEQNGVNYVLSDVMIDGVSVPADYLENFKTTGEFENIASSNIDISFYYVVNAAPAEAEGGAQ